MSFAGRPLLAGPQASSGQTIVVANNQNQSNFPVSTRTILIITFVIILAVVLWTVYQVHKIPITTQQLPVETSLYNLDGLIDLAGNGCCVPPSSIIPDPTYIYDPTSNFTYSTTKVAPSIVCQGTAGITATTCLATVTDKDDTTKPLAHKGITVYYPFAYGPVPSICTSYTPC
uniref:Uncharacterized protein n=1 Tax=viral metagenome TaxID=1070528 RepID=A0A6C0CG64_9ZZZZ